MTTVVLQGGVSVLEDVLRLVLGLEAKGARFGFDEEGRLLVGPEAVVTPEDYQAIVKVRHEVARIVRYVPPPGEWP